MIIRHAMCKYGWDRFSIRKLGEIEVGRLNEAKISVIKYFDSFRNGYNGTIGSGCVVKLHDSDLERIMQFKHNALNIT